MIPNIEEYYESFRKFNQNQKKKKIYIYIYMAKTWLNMAKNKKLK